MRVLSANSPAVLAPEAQVAARGPEEGTRLGASGAGGCKRARSRATRKSLLVREIKEPECEQLRL